MKTSATVASLTALAFCTLGACVACSSTESSSSSAGPSAGGMTMGTTGGTSGSATGGVPGTGAVATGGTGGVGTGGDVAVGGTGGMTMVTPGEPLEIYWVDTEGGAATLIHLPDGTVLLADTGNPGDRDPGRIASVLQNEIGVTHIDHLIITHYHVDHVGGAEALANLVTVGQFIDHGDTVEAGQGANYPTLAAGKRRTVAPGEVLTFGDVTLTIVQSHGQGIATSLAGSDPNPLCNGADPRDYVPDENGMSIGYVLDFGTFEFVDVGDLTWRYEYDLVCPVNKLGVVDLLQVPHHGLDQSANPQFMHSLDPLVAVFGNGPNKGCSPAAFEAVTGGASFQDVWQVHHADGNSPMHNTDENRIANPGGEDQAHFIKAVIQSDGSFVVENSRNAHQVTYQAR